MIVYTQYKAIRRAMGAYPPPFDPYRCPDYAHGG